MRKIKLLIMLLTVCPFLMGSSLEDKDMTITVGEVEVLAYNVEVTWDAMEFTYTETINYKWDNNNHTYEKSNSTYKWKTTSNNVKIDNKSKMPINVELKYIGEKDNINGTFDKEKETIKSNEFLISKLSLDGTLSSNNTSYVKIGKINLLIS